MRKIGTLLLCIVSCFFIASCGSDSNRPAPTATGSADQSKSTVSAFNEETSDNSDPGNRPSTEPSSYEEQIVSEPALGLGITAPKLPANDLASVLSIAASQLADTLNPVVLQGPALAPVPRATCDSRSEPLEGVQGRVTAADMRSDQAKRGWTCNLQQSGYFKIPGRFRVWRYTDKQGQTCAYYDSTLTLGINPTISALAGPTLGVIVLDMDDPSQPRQTTTLTALGMLIPHESLNLNQRRGLLAAAVGNAATLPGMLAIYDVADNCRHPKLLSQAPTITGHESGFSPDGNTFWVAGGAGYIQAYDVVDPANPKQIWRGAYYSHGLNFSDDGNVMFHTDTINGNLGIIDVSQIQARQTHPKVHDISRIEWPNVTIPQNSVPFRNGDHHYLLEFDEFAFRFNPATINDDPGAARIINIDDPSRPWIVSNIRLEVNMQHEHRAANADPNPLLVNQAIGYSFHYCSIPRRDNPQIAACSTINSGLRVFDISDPSHPREVAYFIAPPNAGRLLGLNLTPGNAALSQPAFDLERRQIWYTDAMSGFYVLTLSPAVWSPNPSTEAVTAP